MTIRTSRRSLLRSVAATSLAAPFLGAAARSAHAAGAPRRLLIYASPNTTAWDRFWPVDGRSFGEILKPLEPFRSKTLVMRGINMNSGYADRVPPNHEPHFPNALTAHQVVLPAGQEQWGAVGGISIDQYIANAIKGQTKMASLYIAGEPTESWRPVVAAGQGLPLIGEASPKKVFSSLVGNITGSGGATESARSALRKLQAERKSVLDVLKADVAEVRCRIGSQDRSKLDAHLAAIQEVERSLSFAKDPGAACQNASVASDGSFPAIIRSQMDLTAMAFSCDLTRVVVLQADVGGSERVYSNLGIAGPHHAIAHQVINWTEPYQAITGDMMNSLIAKIDNWHAQQLAYLCQRLEAIPGEDGKPLLDSCAVLWVHEQSIGHSMKDMPYVLVGGCGGYFRSGFLQFAGTEQNSLASHNNLLIELANAMGVPTTTFGDPRFSSGGFPEVRA